jgi:hypothetical protein
VGHLGDGLELGHVVARVADALDVDGLGLVVDGGGDVLGPVAVDELGGDAEAREEHLELVVCAAVQVRRRHDVVARVRQRGDGHELRRLPGRGGHGGDTALERRDPLLEDVDGGALPACQHMLRARTPHARPLTSLSWSRCCQTP